MHLAPYRVEARCILRFQNGVTLHLVTDGLEVNRIDHVSEKVHNLDTCYQQTSTWAFTVHIGITYWFRVPPATSDLEESKVPAERRREADRIWIRLELLVGNCLLHSNLLTVNDPSQVSTKFRAHRIICGLDSQVWDPDGQDRIARGSVAVVGPFCGIAPANSSCMVSKCIPIQV